MELKRIEEIAREAGIDGKYIEPYGKYKAKIDLSLNETLSEKPDGKLVLVTAITPTKFGEGKTTMSIALDDGLNRIGEKSLLCLREPSLGPVFGLKGGATGGGKVTVEPSEEINLHFTGDMHALTSAINLISAVIDNSIFQGNPLHIDPDKVTWKRALDMNDRALRKIRINLSEKKGTPREDGFVITVASELMAILCLSDSLRDFRDRVKKIIVAYTFDDLPVTVDDLKISNAVCKLMKEAIKPNLVQTSENHPCLIHGGPFANIAHGCNSLIATKMALKLAPIVVTEAGFGSDLGAEKFLDIKCQEGGIQPSLVVMVATIRALKVHGGQKLEEIDVLDLKALKEGTKNLKRHVENMRKYGLETIVAINHFASDREEEIAFLKKWCEEQGYPCAFVDGYLKGGEGAVDLANLVAKKLKTGSDYRPLYRKEEPIKTKIERIAKEIYRASDVAYSAQAEADIRKFEAMGFDKTYICIAKTPQSFSDDPSLLNTPEDFTLHVKEVTLSGGANFLVVLTGNILTMPGLPKIPQAVRMEEEEWNF